LSQNCPSYATQCGSDPGFCCPMNTVCLESNRNHCCPDSMPICSLLLRNREEEVV
jgi:hypothetical protein